MIQKSVYIFIISLLFISKVNSQTKTEGTVCCCSSIIESLSVEWKKDSLANNNFCESTYKSLLTCHPDTITIDFMLQKLGKPSYIQENYKGIGYRYYHFDIRTKPKGFDGPLAAWGVVFNFRDGEKYLVSITECDIDL